MERNSSHLSWGYHYLPRSSLLVTQRPNALYQDEREESIVSKYPCTVMASDRSAGNYIAPCYWPSYSGPYGVRPQPAENPTAAKRSCDCSACTTSSPQPFKPTFSTDPRKSHSPVQLPLYQPKDMSTTSDGNAVQSYATPVVSSGLCLPSDCVDSIEPRTQLQDTGPRRGRTVFTAQQLQVLERVFATTQYIVGSQRKFLANQLRLSETQVRVWFQNRRIKWRKQMLTRSING